jgi:RNA polymerase sigma factor (sigma-70 family)
MSADAPPQLHQSPEDRFLAYARTGSKSIIQALIQEYTDRSYSQARRIIGREDGAEDAVQEACMRLVRTANKYDGTVPFAAWLGRLVTSAAVDFRRRLPRRQKNFGALGDQGAIAMEHPNNSNAHVDSPELDALRTVLDTLPDRYRTPLTLHYLSGLDQAETAQALGIPPGTIRVYLARGLKQLRAKLCHAGFSVTSAGLLAIFTTLPTYAASPTFKAGLAASELFAAESLRVSRRMLTAKILSTTTGSVIFKATVVCALAVTAAMILSTTSKSTSIQGLDQVVTTPNQSSFGGTAWPIPGIIEAENFDVGGEGIAYHDLTELNEGRFYRNDGVDIGDEPVSQIDPSHPGPFVGWSRAGEWLEYTVNVGKAGDYTLEARVSSYDIGGKFHIEFNGVDKTGQLTMPMNDGDVVWMTLTATVRLDAGLQVMRIALTDTGVVTDRTPEVANLNYIRLAAAGSP